VPQVLLAAADMRAAGLRSGQPVVLLAAPTDPRAPGPSEQCTSLAGFAPAPSLGRGTGSSAGARLAIGVATAWPSADCKSG
jgi:hypothetical protein